MRTRQVVLEPEAELDLIAIYESVADRASPSVALRFVQRLTAYVDGLKTASERGTLHNEVSPGLRVIGFERRVAVAFKVIDDEVRVFRILYAGQDWMTAFGEDDQR